MPRNQLGRRLPLAYGVTAVVVAVAVLPTALRPPPDSANSSSQFSPDAPPDKKADAIIRSVQLGSSSQTAGQPPRPTLPPSPPPPSRPPSAAPARPAKNGCFPGLPPKQFESVYSVPCQPGFVGDNSGAGDRGVTATEIRLLMAPCNRTYGNNQNTTHEITELNKNDGTPDRTLLALKKYFNKYAEMYGRQLRFYYAGCADNNDVETPIRAVDPLSAVVGQRPDVFAQNKVYAWDYGGNNFRYHRKLNPYNWAAVASGDDTAAVAAEYVCKALKGHKPFPTNNQVRSVPFDVPRKFAAIQTNDPNAESSDQLLNGLKTCGVVPTPNISTHFTQPGDVAGAIAQLIANQVTTVIWNNDLFSLLTYMQAAEGQGYRPEWFFTGWGGVDLSIGTVRGYTPMQSRNLFGLTLNEIARDPRLNECFRAVREMDPGFSADNQTCAIFWAPLAHMVDAIQLAGPELNSATFGAAIPRIPHLEPEPARYWAPSGGYRKDKWSFPDSASVFWWDPSATGVDGQPGTYVYAECARRYRVGTFPTRPSLAYQTRGASTGNTLDTCRP